MPRARAGSARHRRRKRILDAARGYRLSRSKKFRTAHDAVLRAMTNARKDRRLKKRDYRALWITRITAACRARGIRYSEFANGVRKANILLNRKMLSEIAIHDPEGFDAILERVRAALGHPAAAA
jgi:large subunit ribosomal protein L20